MKRRKPTICEFCGTVPKVILVSETLVEGKYATICDTCIAITWQALTDDRFARAIKAGATNVTRLRSRAPRLKPVLEVVA
jgi:hypothetical protein